MNVINATESFAFKWFMSCEFHLKKKKVKKPSLPFSGLGIVPLDPGQKKHSANSVCGRGKGWLVPTV